MKKVLYILLFVPFSFVYSQNLKIKCSEFEGINYSELRDKYGQNNVPCFDSTIAYFKNKAYTGAIKDCHPNGNISETSYRINGICNGITTYYFENGQIEEKGLIKNGNREGEWVIYYKTGRLKVKGGYLKNKPHGVTSYYLENGTLNYKLNFENGKIISCDGNCQEVIESYIAELESRIRTSIKLEEFENAKDYINRILLIRPNDISLIGRRGFVNEKLKLIDLAIIDYTKCISLDPKNYLHYEKRGMCFLSLKQYSKSLADFNVSINLNPQIKELYYIRACVKLLGNLETNSICKDLEKSYSMGYQDAKILLDKHCH
jgi:tetratricopeptide (TPR) repeat protein